MSDDENTPHGRRAGLLRRRAERERLIREAQEAGLPPDYDDDEVSVVELKGEARALRELLRKDSPVPPGPDSLRVKVTKAANSPGGKLGAIITLVVSAIVAAVWQQLAAK